MNLVRCFGQAHSWILVHVCIKIFPNITLTLATRLLKSLLFFRSFSLSLHRDFLQNTHYWTVGFCMLKQSCENALRDWNKVFGEGHMVQGRNFRTVSFLKMMKSSLSWLPQKSLTFENSSRRGRRLEHWVSTAYLLKSRLARGGQTRELWCRTKVCPSGWGGQEISGRQRREIHMAGSLWARSCVWAGEFTRVCLVIYAYWHIFFFLKQKGIVKLSRWVYNTRW